MIQNNNKNNAAGVISSESAERTGVTHKNIGEAWLAIMEEVGYVQKTGELKIGGKLQYKFASEASMLQTLRPVLIKHKVICIPSEAKSYVDKIVTEDGKKTFRTVIDYVFVYTHVPSNTHIQVAVVGEGVDTGDKSAYKAATGALKYALRQPFLIETGDEPEKDETETKQAKVAGVFPTKTARKAFEERLVQQMEMSPDLGELKAVWDEAHPILTELKASDNEEDSYCYAHLLKMKDMTKSSIQALS